MQYLNKILTEGQVIISKQQASKEEVNTTLEPTAQRYGLDW
jgi:hypothetical protein